MLGPLWLSTWPLRSQPGTHSSSIHFSRLSAPTWRPPFFLIHNRRVVGPRVLKGFRDIGERLLVRHNLAFSYSLSSCYDSFDEFDQSFPRVTSESSFRRLGIRFPQIPVSRYYSTGNHHLHTLRLDWAFQIVAQATFFSPPKRAAQNFSLDHPVPFSNRRGFQKVAAPDEQVTAPFRLSGPRRKLQCPLRYHRAGHTATAAVITTLSGECNLEQTTALPGQRPRPPGLPPTLPNNRPLRSTHTPRKSLLRRGALLPSPILP